MRGPISSAAVAALVALLVAVAAHAETTLVVVKPPDGKVVTHWLESDGNAHEIKAVLPVPLFALGEVIHAWRTVPAELSLCDCAALEDWAGSGRCPPSGRTGKGTSLQLISLADGRFTVPVTGRSLQPGEVISRYRARVHLLGTVGPFLFLHREQWLRSCLAEEDLQESEFLVWDLARGRQAVLYDRREVNALTTSEQVEAFEQLRDVTTAHSFKDLEFTAIHPLWDGDELALAYQFTAPVCSTCGDDTWATGLASTLVPAEGIPKKLQGDTAPPRGLATFRMAHPDDAILGWTQLDGSQAERNAQLARLLSLVR